MDRVSHSTRTGGLMLMVSQHRAAGDLLVHRRGRLIDDVRPATLTSGGTEVFFSTPFQWARRPPESLDHRSRLRIR